MKGRYSARGLAGLFVAVLLSGCATPATRIKHNPELFNSFPPEVREQVRQGRIGVGFTKDMVLMALGRPDHRYVRQCEGGPLEVWSYSSYDYDTTFHPVTTPYWYRGSNGHYYRTWDWDWVDVTTRTEYQRLRVEFRDDKVSAFEHRAE